MTSFERWRELGQQLRVDSIRPSAIAGSGHPTSGMSAADLMAVLADGYLRYDWSDPDRATNDRLVFSKGHASTLLYGDLPRGRRDLRRRPRDVPDLRQHARGAPDAGDPVGRRRHRLARPGAADRGRDGDRRQVPRPPSLPRVRALRRQRDGRGLRSGRRSSMPRTTRSTTSSRSSTSTGSASAARRWSAGGRPSSPSGPARSVGTRSRSTGTTSRRSTSAYAEAEAQTGQPTAILARTLKGKGVAAVEDAEGWHGKPLDDPEGAIAELGGIRNLRLEVRVPEPGEPHVFETGPARAPALRARRGGRDAEGLRRGARGTRLSPRRRRRGRR